MKILVTGGCGFIGSHTCVELLNDGYEVVIVDNLYNSQQDVIQKIETITNKKVNYYIQDVLNEDGLRQIFSEHKIDGVIHFAGYKAVGESVAKPIMYYQNNLGTTLSLCKVMAEFDCNLIIFSSSATVYGNPASVPIFENFPLSTTNPYGTTKLFCERILEDIAFANKNLSVCLLRYFNPVGAHESGLLGESPNDIPNNLMPYITKVANKELPHLNIFGNDYPTIDGTGVRDYIHVVDLAKGHVKAIEYAKNRQGVDMFNLGTGTGYSVLQIVNAFSTINNVEVPYVIAPRRPGDIPTCFADTAKAKELLNWEATKTLEEMMKDSWHFILKNKQ